MSQQARTLLKQWLMEQLSPEQRDWLSGQLESLGGSPADTVLAMALGLVPRRLGAQALRLDDDQRAQARAALPGWTPERWSIIDAARILIVSGLPADDPPFAARLQSLCQTADPAELAAFYRGLSLYPAPRSLEPLVGEGLRSNMRQVFEAIVHDNPYPRTHLDTHRWNHMVLKALFIDCPLAPVQGLDERANEELARIMLDFAHERWAAGRVVPWEIWRCVGPFARGAALDDLDRALSGGTPIERRAAALALAASPDPQARGRLAAHPELARDIEAGRLDWNTVVPS